MNKTYQLLVSLILTTSSILAQDAVEIAKKTFPSTVSIVMQDKFKQPLSLGSGFIIENGKVVTNVHVIKGAVYGEIIEDDTKQTHEIVGYTSINNKNDLVILSVPSLTKSGINIVNKMPVIGERIYAIGNPEKTNILWGITSTGALAYFNEAQFESLNKTAKKQTLTMNIISPDKLSYDAITSLFSIY